MVTYSTDEAKIRFSGRLNKLLDEAGYPPKGEGRQIKVAKQFGVSQKGARKWLECESIPRRENIEKLAAELNCELEYLEYGTEAAVREEGFQSDDHAFQVIYHKRKAAAGKGSSDKYGDSEGIYFLWSWAERLGLTRTQVTRLKAIRVKGDSMSPTLNDGELMVIRTDMRTIVNGRVYVFNQDGDERTKRLYKHKKGILIVSDNPDPAMGPEFIPSDESPSLTIIGEVIWRSGKVI